MDFLSPIVSCVVNTVANPILKHVKYPFTAGGNVQALAHAIKDLQAEKDGVNEKIEDAKREHGVETSKTELWKSKVDDLEKEAKVIQDKYGELRRCCFCNICPNVWSVYKISKMAANQLVEANKLCYEKKPKPDEITRVKLPQHHAMPIPSSESPYLISALGYVEKDEHGIIGICGMGGVGKTHLMKQIYGELVDPEKREKYPVKFDKVVYLECSNQCSNVEEIQNKILDHLHCGKGGSMEQKQNTICMFLQNKSFMLLLDNLWSHVDLSTIGIC